MKKILIGLGATLFVGLLGLNAYCTYANWVTLTHTRKVVNHNNEYLYAAIDCLIQENGAAEGDAELARQGLTRAQARKKFPDIWGSFKDKQPYSNEIPECHDFYSHYRCWELDATDPKSLDGCGLHFGLTQEEIDTMKRDPTTIKRVMNENWDRKKKSAGQ